MTNPHSDFAYPEKRCQWCGRQTGKLQKGNNCSHSICDKCNIKESGCRSNCPPCWSRNIKAYLEANRICAVCCNGIKPNDRLFYCTEKHLHCPTCISGGCLLCQFDQWKASNDGDYRELATNRKNVLYPWAIWEKKFEESPILKHPTSSGDDNDSENISDSSQSKKARKESKKPVESNDCIICLERLDSSSITLSHCKHQFHKKCIDTWFESSGKESCPSCGYVYKISKGPQPSNGQMVVKYLREALPGYEYAQNGPSQGPTIEITYIFPSGTQGPLNPKPNQPFSGTTRRAYLPNTPEGRAILDLLKRAFNDRHIFTIGRSTTTGQDNVVTWNDIHHKTSIHGGPQNFGYPDPTYLLRVRQELADKGYK